MMLKTKWGNRGVLDCYMVIYVRHIHICICRAVCEHKYVIYVNMSHTLEEGTQCLAVRDSGPMPHCRTLLHCQTAAHCHTAAAHCCTLPHTAGQPHTAAFTATHYRVHCHTRAGALPHTSACTATDIHAHCRTLPHYRTLPHCRTAARCRTAAQPRALPHAAAHIAHIA
jgi:hypothetical protein